jgi:hypothetical protein
MKEAAKTIEIFVSFYPDSIKIGSNQIIFTFPDKGALDDALRHSKDERYDEALVTEIDLENLKITIR